MIVMNCVCPQCQSNNFEIRQLWNDDSETRQPDEWRYTLDIACADCKAIVCKVEQLFDDSYRLTEEFASDRP